MDLSKLVVDLSEYGTVHVCKANKVFVLYMTGISMESFATFSVIHQLILKTVGEKYPLVEVLHNGETHLLIVYKQKD